MKALYKHYFLPANKFKAPPSINSSNLTPPATTSTSAQHVGVTTAPGVSEVNAPASTISRLNPGALEDLDEYRFELEESPLSTRAITPIERRKARSIQDFPEALRQQVAAAPKHFHNMILQAYTKPPRRLLEIRLGHVGFNPPSGRNVGKNLL